MKLSISIVYTVLSSATPVIVATKEDQVDLLVKKIDKLTDVVGKLTTEVEVLKLEQSPRNDHRFLSKSSKKKPTPAPTATGAEQFCPMTAAQCGNLKVNVVDTLAHQSSDIMFTHTEQCEAFKYLFGKYGDAAADDLLKVLHCDAEKTDPTKEYDMVLVTSPYDNANPFEPVTSTDPKGPYYQACEGLVNIGKCHSNFDFYCHWFTHGYVAHSIPMVTGEVNFQVFCTKACQNDPFCKASYYANQAHAEVDCNIIHVASSVDYGTRPMCSITSVEPCLGSGGNHPNYIYVKQEKGSNFCKNATAYG